MKNKDSKYPLSKKDGLKRQIGYEIEYAGLSLEDSANFVAEFFDGKISKPHDNKFEIETTSGLFVVLVDFELLQDVSKYKPKSQIEAQLQKTTKMLLEELSADMVPLEIVTPPLDFNLLSKMDEFCELLAEKGAKGTQESALYGFGLHLNIDIPAIDALTVLRYLQSFCLLEAWMETQVNRDITRTLTMYTSLYPMAYKKLICKKSYNPNLQKLINDYLRCNPTRNHALDMLPLFAMEDEQKVKLATDGDSLIKKRPAFHYRLPNSRIGDKYWSPSREWSVWENVEVVANNDELRSELLKLWKKSYILSFFSEGKYLKALQDIL